MTSTFELAGEMLPRWSAHAVKPPFILVVDLLLADLCHPAQLQMKLSLKPLHSCILGVSTIRSRVMEVRSCPMIR